MNHQKPTIIHFSAHSSGHVVDAKNPECQTRLQVEGRFVVGLGGMCEIKTAQIKIIKHLCRTGVLLGTHARRKQVEVWSDDSWHATSARQDLGHTRDRQRAASGLSGGRGLN